jgi:hypothetical protein
MPYMRFNFFNKLLQMCINQDQFILHHPAVVAMWEF